MPATHRKAARASSQDLQPTIDPPTVKPEFVGAMQIVIAIGGAGMLAGGGQELVVPSVALIVLTGVLNLASGGLLTAVPGIGWIGKIVMDRVLHAHTNWMEQPLRSLTETAVWLYVIFTVQANGENFNLSILIGALCGVPIALLGELLRNFFEKLQTMLTPGSRRQVFQPGFVWLAYFCGVFLAHTLSSGDQCSNHQLSSGDQCSTVLTSVLTGALLITAGQLLIAWRPTRSACQIMQGRILDARHNWLNSPTRSAVELSAFAGSLWGSYIMTNSPLLSIGLSTCAGIAICLSCEHTLGEMPDASSLSEFPMLLPLASVDLTLMALYTIFSNAHSLPLALGLSLISSVVVCAIGRLCLLFPCTLVVGKIIDGRIRNVVENWSQHPLRSMYEVVFFQVCLFMAYTLYDGNMIPALRLGCALGGINVLVMNFIWPPDDSIQHSARVSPRITPATAPPVEPLAASKAPSTEEIRINQRIVRCVDAAAPMQVGVDGNWIDVKQFAQHHPGGDVIFEFFGRDATSQFYAFHSPSVLKRFKTVGTYDMTATETGKEPSEMAFLEMVKRLDAEGYFGSEESYYYRKVAICAGLMIGVVVGLLLGHVVVPGAMLGMFWMQAGFLTHDLMHNQIFKKRKVDQAHGWFWGNICLGASGVWWRDEHFEHHVFTNTYLKGTGSTDPQQHEAPLWAQDQALTDTTNPFLQRIQHFTFLPILIIAGRFGLILASYSMQRGLKEHLGTVLHWVYVSILLRVVWVNHAWMGVLTFYMAGACVQGILGVQLSISHYDKEFIEKEDAKDHAGWLRRQVYVSKDISCPWWMDWFHGGLNLHRVHHLMPRLSRCRYREVTVQLDKLLDEHKIKSDVEPFFTAVSSTLSHMRKQALLVTMTDLIGG